MCWILVHFRSSMLYQIITNFSLSSAIPSPCFRLLGIYWSYSPFLWRIIAWGCARAHFRPRPGLVANFFLFHFFYLFVLFAHFLWSYHFFQNRPFPVLCSRLLRKVLYLTPFIIHLFIFINSFFVINTTLFLRFRSPLLLSFHLLREVLSYFPSVRPWFIDLSFLFFYSPSSSSASSFSFFSYSFSLFSFSSLCNIFAFTVFFFSFNLSGFYWIW